MTPCYCYVHYIVAKTGGRESPLTFLIVGEDVQTFEGTCGATGM